MAWCMVQGAGCRVLGVWCVVRGAGCNLHLTIHTIGLSPPGLDIDE